MNPGKSILLLLFAALLTLALLGIPALLAAQSSSDGSGSTAPFFEKGSIAGHVTGIDSSLIGSAYVTAWTSDPLLAEWGKGSALVDSQFTFRIDSLAPGDYYVIAEASGYIPLYYPGVTDWTEAKMVSVSAGQTTKEIDFALQPGIVFRGGTISGRITGPDGNAIPNVSVEASTIGIDSVKSDVQYAGWAASDENGDYFITGLNAGLYYVHADYWGGWFGQTLWYPQATTIADAKQVQLDEDATANGIDFNFSFISKSGIVQGQVLDGVGNPIENAGIQLMVAPAPSGPWNWIWLYATTDGKGRYRIENVPDGEYIAYCWAQAGWQYTQRWWPNGETAEQAKVITIAEGQNEWQIDFKLPLTPGTSSIIGIVRARDGHPLANAYVQITSEEINADQATARSIYAYSVTDAAGNYSVDKLPEGKYIAYASYWEDMRFGQAWYKDADSLSKAEPIILMQSEMRTEIDFNLLVRPIYGAIVGVVRNALTGEPISRAYVEIRYQHAAADIAYRPFAWWPYQVITDEFGQFSVDWLPEGSYLVAVYANGGFAWYPDAPVQELATPVKVVGGEKSEANFNLTLRQEGTGGITGYVKADYRAMPMQYENDGKGARQAAVLEGYIPEIAIVMAKPALTILAWPQSELFYTAITDPDGAYSLKGLPAGEYYVMSFAPGHMLQYYKETFDPAEAKLVRVIEAEVVGGIDFNLQPRFWDMIKEGDNRGASPLNASIAGNITDTNNKSVVGATVYLLDSQGQPLSWTTSDQNGRYEILGVAPGQYYVQAGKLGFSTSFNGNAQSRENTTPVVAANGITEVDVVLKPAGSTGVKEELLPESVELYGNYPNPFNPETRLYFALPQPMHVTLTIHDLLGREIMRLQDGTLPEGSHRLRWDGRNASGATVSSGVYWYRLATPGLTRTGKMVLMR